MPATAMPLTTRGPTPKTAKHYSLGELPPRDHEGKVRAFSRFTRLPCTTSAHLARPPAPAAFLRVLAGLVAQGGLLVLSTLNRTAAFFVAAKLVAAYALRWLPVGTHDWRRFLTPAELSRHVRDAGLAVGEVAGLSPDLLRGGWRVGRDLRVNYLLSATGRT